MLNAANKQQTNWNVLIDAMYSLKKYHLETLHIQLSLYVSSCLLTARKYGKSRQILSRTLLCKIYIN